MPSYTYECSNGHVEERTCSIADMERFEGSVRYCQFPDCPAVLSRVYHPPGRHLTFREGFYENVTGGSDMPGGEKVWISSMQQLNDLSEKHGVYSHYAEDLGGAFGRKRRRWI